MNRASNAKKKRENDALARPADKRRIIAILERWIVLEENYPDLHFDLMLNAKFFLCYDKFILTVLCKLSE